METQNENQKPKLSLKEIFRNQIEICRSIHDCIKDGCSFHTDGDGCMVSDLNNIIKHSDEIERICIEWETEKPTLAKKINDILKPYGLILERRHIWFNDNLTHTSDDVEEKLYSICYKEAANDMD